MQSFRAPRQGVIFGLGSLAMSLSPNSLKFPPSPRLSCVLEKNEKFIVARKPWGWSTHESSPYQPGFAEYLSSLFKEDLKVVHRLDVGTTGLLLLARNASVAKELSESFQRMEMRKTYSFITDRRPRESAWKVETHLDRGKDKISRSIPNLPVNAVTEFELIQEEQLSGKNYYLIRARPQSGRPHQIRAHALESGVPLVGDREYQGSPALRFFLYAAELEWTDKDGKRFHYVDPEFKALLKNLLLNLEETLLTQLSANLKNRMELLPQELLANPKSCFRATHHEIEDLEIDVFGKNIWIYLRNPERFASAEKSIPSFLNALSRSIENVYLMDMKNRGVGGVSKELYIYQDKKFILCDSKDSQNQISWSVEENQVQFILKNHVGFSPGLFLDQRENRRWVKENSHNLKVLNLFSYTGGFSVCAAVGGALEVCTVDVSPVFHNWCKENFALNHLDPAKFEFWNQDTLLFLKGCRKRQRQFDLIICDPPSLGRSKDRVFKIEKDWVELLHLCLDSLSEKGTLLFSNNYEAWSQLEWLDKLEKELRAKKGFQIQAGLRGADYEPFQMQPAMKSFIISRK